MAGAVEISGRNLLMSMPSNAKKRQTERDSLFLSSEVTVQGIRKPVTVRVRNLSPGGMMIDGNPIFHEGLSISAELRGIGPVAGHIAWVMSDRAGVAFDSEIDPREARISVVPAKPRELFNPVLDKSRRPGLKLR